MRLTSATRIYNTKKDSPTYCVYTSGVSARYNPFVWRPSHQSYSIQIEHFVYQLIGFIDKKFISPNELVCDEGKTCGKGLFQTVYACFAKLASFIKTIETLYIGHAPFNLCISSKGFFSSETHLNQLLSVKVSPFMKNTQAFYTNSTIYINMFKFNSSSSPRTTVPKYIFFYSSQAATFFSHLA